MQIKTSLLIIIALLLCIFIREVHAMDFKLPEKLPAHPRLFLTKQREAELRQQMQSDEFLVHLVAQLIAKADKLKQAPPSEYKIPDGLRLLYQSRRSLERTSTLAFAYRMTGQQQYANAAIKEMLTVCRFQDWNPKHYLDVGEMATAVGIGFDWLYDAIPPNDRDEIKNAIVKHAMNTALLPNDKNNWWLKRANNWNEVCNAGLTIGALAIADEEPQLAERVIKLTLASFPTGLSVYKPDGAYPEGPMYWAYGASFTGLMFKVLDDVFKDDFGFLKSPGLSTTGDYYMGAIGPNYLNFNYADGGEKTDASPMMFALSTLYNRPDYAVWVRTFIEQKDRYAAGRLAVFHAIWYNPANADLTKTPLVQLFRGIQDVCTMRTAWNDPNAAFLGFKAGNNRASHGHLDIGSFIYEVNGVRWAVDLGVDNYNLPAYFGGKRWDYFRLNTRSHNTLLIGDKNQNLAADCKIIQFKLDKDPTTIAQATADMTAAYAGQAQFARRTATLRRDGSVVIEDTLHGVTEPVRWAMLTKAKANPPTANAITLQQENKLLHVEFASPNLLRIEMLSAQPPTKQENQNLGHSILAAFVTPIHGRVNLRVVLTPGTAVPGLFSW